jgi:hypothetical protein
MPTAAPPPFGILTFSTEGASCLAWFSSLARPARPADRGFAAIHRLRIAPGQVRAGRSCLPSRGSRDVLESFQRWVAARNHVLPGTVPSGSGVAGTGVGVQFLSPGGLPDGSEDAVACAFVAAVGQHGQSLSAVERPRDHHARVVRGMVLAAWSRGLWASVAGKDCPVRLSTVSRSPWRRCVLRRVRWQ